MGSYEVQPRPIEAEHVCKQAAAERNRILHNCFEHRPGISRRGTYSAKDLCGRRLLFARLVKLATAPIQLLSQADS
jgi:hypothetical protein